MRWGRLVLPLLLAATVVPTGDAAAQLPPASHYRNPVYDRDFADPFVLRAGGAWYAYGTHGWPATNVQILRSPDLVNWHTVGDALPLLPGWAEGPRVWAPSVLAAGGRHVLYYSVTDRRSGKFCISRGVGDGPEGPFFDRSTAPLVCQPERGGTIDPSAFRDAQGRPWLAFKSEGVRGREPTRLWSQPLSPDGTAVTGTPAELLHTELAWEEPIIENPAMTHAGGRYILLYSANRWETRDYAVGWASCRTPAGPCIRGSDRPLISTSGAAAGPGGADFFADADGRPWISYHAWTDPHVGYREMGARSLRIDPVTFAHGRPWVDAPTTTRVAFGRSPAAAPPPAPPAPPPVPPTPAPPPAPARPDPAASPPSTAAPTVARPAESTAPTPVDPAPASRRDPAPVAGASVERPAAAPTDASRAPTGGEGPLRPLASALVAMMLGAHGWAWRRRATLPG